MFIKENQLWGVACICEQMKFNLAQHVYLYLCVCSFSQHGINVILHSSIQSHNICLEALNKSYKGSLIMKFILNKVNMDWRCMWSMDSSRRTYLPTYVYILCDKWTCDCIFYRLKDNYINSMLGKTKVRLKENYNDSMLAKTKVTAKVWHKTLQLIDSISAMQTKIAKRFWKLSPSQKLQ